MLAPGSCLQACCAPGPFILAPPGLIPRHCCRTPEAMTTSTAAGAGTDGVAWFEVSGAGWFDAGALLDAEGLFEGEGLFEAEGSDWLDCAETEPLGRPQCASERQKINVTAERFIVNTLYPIVRACRQYTSRNAESAKKRMRFRAATVGRKALNAPSLIDTRLLTAFPPPASYS